MVQSIDMQGVTRGDMKSDSPEKGYSIKEVADGYGLSESTVKLYKATLVKAFEADQRRVLTEARSLNQYGFEQIKEVQKYHKIGNPNGYCFAVWQEFPELANGLANDVANGHPEQPVTHSVVDISSPNMQTVKLGAIALVNDQASLASWQTGDAIAIDDPIAVVNQAHQYLSLLEGAMEQDRRQKQEKLSQTEQALQALRERATEFKIKSELYRRDDEMVAQQLTQKTVEMSQAFNQVQELGKQG